MYPFFFSYVNLGYLYIQQILCRNFFRSTTQLTYLDFRYLTPVTFHRYRHHGYYSTGVVYYVSDLAIAFYGNKSLHIYLVLTVSVFLFMTHIIPEVTVWNYHIIPQLTFHIFSAWWLANLHWGICIHKQMLIFGQSPSPIKGLYYRYISIFIERFGNSVCRLESFILP